MRPFDRMPRALLTRLVVGLLLAAAPAALAPAPAHAQKLNAGDDPADDPIAEDEPDETYETDEAPIVAVPDRPGFSTAPYTVPVGQVQFEAGASTVVDGSEVALALPTLLARIGIAETFELGFGFPSYEVALTGTDSDEDDSGLGDAQITGKWAIPVGELAAVGVLPFLTIPVDHDGADDSVTLGGLLLWQVQTTERVLIFSNIGAFTGPDPNTTGTAFGGVTSLGVGLTLSDAWGAYVEGYSYFGSGDGVEPVADGGLSYAITPWLVADAWVGFGFAESALLGGLGITLAR